MPSQGHAVSTRPTFRLGGARSWIICVVAGIAAYATTSQGLVLYGERWQVPLIVGLVVGLVAVIPWQGALAAVMCMLGGMLLAPPFLTFSQKPGVVGWVLAMIVAPLSSAGFAYLLSRLEGKARRQLTRGLAIVLVAWTLVSLWLPLTSSGWPPAAFGPLDAAVVRAIPAPGQVSADEGLYRRVFALMHHGESYYPAFHDAWLAVTTSGLPTSPAGFRLPTYFWLLRLLPNDAFAIVYVYLGFASIGIVAAAFVAGQLVGPRLAPLAALALAAYAIDIAYSSYVVFLDMPAMCVALVAVALYVRAARTRSMAVLWSAAAVLTLAALTREILAYLVVLAALSAALEARGERLRRTIPWLASLVVVAAGYAAHIVAVRGYLGETPGSVTYLHGGPAYLEDLFNRFTGSMAGGASALVLFVALGIAAAIASRRRAGIAFAAFATVSIVLPLIAMLILGNPGRDVNGVANYWGMLVVPIALALWPAAALLLAPRMDRTTN